MKPLDAQQRSRLGNIASFIGILVNIVLAAGKMLVGALFGVISMLADGLNNLTDCGSSAISILSFKLSAKPADKEHPYGHERIEYVCSMIVAFIILLVAFETAKESIGKIITPSPIEFSYLVIGTLIASIAVCFPPSNNSLPAGERVFTSTALIFAIAFAFALARSPSSTVTL